ncbi:hypothetical protein ACFQL9_12500, partial [Halobaculum lipolyticum]
MTERNGHDPGRAGNGAGANPLAAGGGGDGVPDFREARRHVLIEVVRFAAVLRRDGVDVPPSGTLAAARALAVVGLSDRDRAEAALRASLLSDASGADAFEEAFPSFWHRLRSGLSAIATADGGPERDVDDGAGGDDPTTPDAVAPASDGAASADDETLAGADPPALDADDADGGRPEIRIPTGRRQATGERAAEDGEHDARRASAIAGGETVEAAVAPTTADRNAVARLVDALAT